MQVSRALVLKGIRYVWEWGFLISRASDIGWEGACVGRAVPSDYG